METYCEPTYPLTKTEHFDETTMSGIWSDEAFSKADRSKLTLYNRHKIGAGKVLVSYRLGMGCEAFCACVIWRDIDLICA
jgi:hypothetical protein